MSQFPERREAGSSNAGPLGMDVFTGQSANYTEAPPTAIVLPFSKDRVRRRRFASVRLKEMYTLAMYRRREGFVVYGINFVHAIAFHLACDQAGRIVEPGAGDGGKAKVVPWTGLSLETLQHAIESAELGHFGEDELQGVIDSVKQWREANGTRLTKARKLGLDLQLTAIEREACGIRTIEAVDEPKAERQVRIREAKLLRDRERRRLSKKRKPRALYEADSLSQTKPWDAEGIGRRAWEKRRAKQFASVSPTIESQQATHLRTEGGMDAPAAPAPFLQNEKILMQVMCPEEAHPVTEYVSGQGDVAAPINRAVKILKARRPKGPRFYDDPLEEALTLLKGLSMIARFERQNSSDMSQLSLRVAAIESAKLIQAGAANDNRLAEIARLFAA